MITPTNLKNYSGIQHQFLEPLHQIHCLLVISMHSMVFGKLPLE